MVENSFTSQEQILQSQLLCADEVKYIQERKKGVLKFLSSLGIDCATTCVPHIAVLGSGGGERAAVAMLGSLEQMEKEHLLDAVLYIGGISGSTWAMASLYSDPQWSTNVDKAISKLKGPWINLTQVLAWLDERTKEENFSLSDIWAALISAGIMKQLELRHLSEEAGRNASNPYPIYCAIERECCSQKPSDGKWFELSPHETGFTEFGPFVETSLLGSKFQFGRLLEKKPEMDMVKLQGVCGSALADWKTNKHHLVEGAVAELYPLLPAVLEDLIYLIKSITEDPAALSLLDELEIILKEHLNHHMTACQKTTSLEERESLSQQITEKLLMAWNNHLETKNASVFSTLWLVLRLWNYIIPLLFKWEWGTTRNFLHDYNSDDMPAVRIPLATVLPNINSAEKFYLIDAGLWMNVPYPPFLGDKRDIDLIIAPDFSAGNIFETLTLARDYAAKVKKPFPKIDEKILEEKKWPKSCYVFKGKDKEPTIVYMPLFNRNNCKDPSEFQRKMKEFKTFQHPYSNEKIDSLLDIARDNIKNNKNILLEEIENATLRKKSRK